uniref:Uncharacterized protein n=1 Tax=Nelumbo nucifera TaxID=4432 RepID=A0A822XYL8_NELNU|nr:TPA_asm: hypothetical protein HUJ06_026576 [Nelumbo nucifera]
MLSAQNEYANSSFPLFIFFCPCVLIVSKQLTPASSSLIFSLLLPYHTVGQQSHLQPKK